MKKLLSVLILLSACGDRGGEGNNAVAPGNGVSTAVEESGSASPAASTRLTGLYEGGDGARKNQLCIIEKGSDAQFGLVVWGDRNMSCSGAGKAVKSGERVTFTMAGDRTCSIQANLKEGTITLPPSVPEGCSYYCAEGARLTGARFTRAGSTTADAMKAKDLADDPLCG